jgi:predicted kinase
VHESHRSRSGLVVLVTGLQGTGKSTAADGAGAFLGAAVLAHDWAMSGLRPYPEIQSALDAMEPPGHGPVGWSILLALARAQLRRGPSVVLDGVARAPEIGRCRALAGDVGARFVLVLTECTDIDVHRSRIEGRRRHIPDWYEVEWDQVQRARARWERPRDVDVVLEATDPPDKNMARLAEVLATRSAEVEAQSLPEKRPGVPGGEVR